MPRMKKNADFNKFIKSFLLYTKGDILCKELTELVILRLPFPISCTACREKEKTSRILALVKENEGDSVIFKFSAEEDAWVAKVLF